MGTHTCVAAKLLARPQTKVIAQTTDRRQISQALELARKAHQANTEEECERAISLSTAAIAQDPNCSFAYKERAHSLLEMGKESAALSDLTAGLKCAATSERYPLLKDRALILSALKRYKQALADFDALSKLGDYKCETIRMSRAISHMGIGKPLLAVSDLTSESKNSLVSRNMLIVRARAYTEAKQPEKALADYNRLIPANKKAEDLLGVDSSLFLKRARIYDQLGQQNLAEIDRKRAAAAEKINLEHGPFRSID